MRCMIEAGTNVRLSRTARGFIFGDVGVWPLADLRTFEHLQLHPSIRYAAIYGRLVARE